MLKNKSDVGNIYVNLNKNIKARGNIVGSIFWIESAKFCIHHGRVRIVVIIKWV